MPARTIKISLIGAGSAAFSLSLVRDVCLTPNLAGARISFMDIDPVRLNAAYTLCTRFAAEVGATLQIEQTTSREESLAGADFVINTALAAGHHRLREGWDIARTLGYRMGGSLHIMHDEPFWVNFYQLRLFESIVEDMLRICPDAWYIQVANPVFAGITHLARKYPQAKIVGTCHGFSGVYNLAAKLGYDRDGLTFQIPGVNHFVWLTDLYYKGENILPKIETWLASNSEAYWATTYKSDDMGRKAFDLYRRFGVFPIGDTCTPGGGSWPYWYHTDDETETRWHEDPLGWYAGYFAGQEHYLKLIRDLAENPSARVTEHFPPKHSGEVFIPIVESIAFDLPRIIIGNIANEGEFVPGIPRDVAVEIPMLVSARGIQGVRTGGLPKPVLTCLLRDRVASMEMELDAYNQCSRNLLRQLVLMDPYTQNEAQADALLEGILALPYHEEMRAHYRHSGFRTG